MLISLAYFYPFTLSSSPIRKWHLQWISFIFAYAASFCMSCQSSICSVSFPWARIFRVWPLSPAPFIYKAVIWNTMLTVCSPMLAVSTEPCGAANLSLEQCLEFDTQQSRVFSVSWELITKSLAPQISLTPLNHYIRLNVPYNDQNTIKNHFIWHRCIIMNTWHYLNVSEFLRSFCFTPLTCSSRKKKTLSGSRNVLKG